MSRIACLLVPDFPVAAACRADPALIGVPFALAETSAPHGRLLAVSRVARARGVRAGQTIAQGRTITADLAVRRRDPAAERSATLAVLDVAASLASRVELAGDGVVFLDAAGASHLLGTGGHLGTTPVARAAKT